MQNIEKSPALVTPGQNSNGQSQNTTTTHERQDDANKELWWGRCAVAWLPLLGKHPNALITLIAISAYLPKNTNTTWPVSASELAQATGIRQDRVFATIKKLENLGLITRVSGGLKKRNCYQIHLGKTHREEAMRQSNIDQSTVYEHRPMSGANIDQSVGPHHS